MYDDEYNRKIASTVLARSERKGKNVDRLNGAGSNDGPEAEDRKEYPASHWFKQENQVFQDDITRQDVQPASVVRARAKLDLGSGKYSGGSGMVGFPDRAPLSSVEPANVVRKRANLDLGAGRAGAGRSGGFFEKLKKGLSVANKAGEAFLSEDSKLRKGLNVADQTSQAFAGQGYSAAGRSGGFFNKLKKGLDVANNAGEAFLPEDSKLRKGLDIGAQTAGLFSKGQGYSGGMGFLGQLAMVLAPAILSKLTGKGKSGAGMSVKKLVLGLASMYDNKKISKGSLTANLKQHLPHGMKKDATKIAAAIVRVLSKKRGKGYSGSGQFDYEAEGNSDVENDDESEGMEGGALPLHMSGCGDYEADRKVGGRQCNCKCKCGKGRSGAGLSGGYGPVAPTTESLYGYDNREQSTGLKPPPSVNQQAGMCGKGRSRKCKGGFVSDLGVPVVSDVAGMFGFGQQPVSLQKMGRNLLPQSQLPSGVGGAKGGRAMANTKNYASNSGAIIPSMQSRVSIGSGRAQRGAMVSKLMREHGMSLGEASRYIKEHKM